MVVTVVYVLAGAVAAVVAFQEVARGPTKAELDQAAAAEVAGRWHSWPVGEIFPARIPYEPEQGGDAEQAARVGIAPGASCSESVDGAAAAVLRRNGCAAVLRATYLDQTKGMVITLGVVAFTDPAAAARAGPQFSEDGKPVPGVRAAGFPNTPAGRFNDAARQASFARQGGPYLILATVGQSDGRPAQGVRKAREGLFALAPEMASRLGATLSKPARPDCTKPERWAC